MSSNPVQSSGLQNSKNIMMNASLLMNAKVEKGPWYFGGETIQKMNLGNTIKVWKGENEEENHFWNENTSEQKEMKGLLIWRTLMEQSNNGDRKVLVSSQGSEWEKR